MDVLIDIIAFIIRALVDRSDPKSTPRPPQPRSQLPARGTQVRTPPLASLTKSSSQDPEYDDRGWRLALSVLAIIALIVMVAVWFAYTQGWLSPA